MFKLKRNREKMKRYLVDKIGHLGLEAIVVAEATGRHVPVIPNQTLAEEH